MLKNVKHLSFFILHCGLVLALGACSDKTDNAITNIVEDPELNGRYMGACQSSELTGFSMRESLRFTVEGEFTRYQDFYTNADCSEAESAGTVEIVGQYSVDDDGGQSGAFETLELNLQQAFVLPRTDALVAAMNTVNFCGSNNYQLGQEHEVTVGTDNPLCPVEDVPVKLFGVYKEEDGNLYLNEGGVSSMTSDPAERPFNINQDSVYVKQ